MPPPRPSADTRKPYPGHTRSLVIAIDIGTTFSGVSYAILEPGEIPKIHGVTRFPGQEHVAGNTKIPSVIYYDRHGKMMAAGAEADTSAIQAQAEDETWIRAELFKLRLRPRTMQLNMNGMRLGPLPKRKTAVHVFGDFLAYLYRCTRNFITDTHANGAVLWNQVENDIQFVLSHPNGWEGAQQSKMRRAAVYGGLIPESNEGKARIRFVTEGEASLHACVLNGLAADVLSNPSKHGFLIADAGGGTLDISAYAIRGTSPLAIEEIAPPDCIFAGSVFVSRRARGFLEEKLKNSRYGTPDALDHITRRFDETTKRLFRDRRDLQFIPFGSPLDKDSSVGIRGGQLKLTGQEVADLFEPSVDAAFKAIKAQIEASQGMIKSVFLVGGYAASPWLFGQLQERLAPYEVVVSRPDTQTSKAVADGAIGFYCDHHVSARMSKFMYGVEFLREMDPRDPDHVARKERLCELPSGPKLLPDAFDCILSRGVRVKESTVFTRKYCTELTSLSMLSVFEVEIWCYRGGGDTIPLWINRQADNFSTLCVVRADLSPLASSAEPKAGKGGKTYWTIVFSVEIQFGLTEFKARIKWVDSGMTKYGPASIIYNERGHRADEDEPDVFPEDEANTLTVNNTPRSAAANRSEPVSRARTPVAESVNHSNHSQKQPSIPPSTVSSRRPSTSYARSELSYASGTGPVIPDAARMADNRDRDRSVSRAQSVSSKNGYESDRRTVSSSKSKDRERDLRSERTETPRATPKSSKIGETLTAVWGTGGGSQHVSPRHSTQPSPALGVTDPPLAGGSTTRGSSVYGGVGASEKTKSPSQHSTRSSQQHNKSPYVETISTTIENPKGHSPWDTVPSSGIPRSRTISNASGHNHSHTPHTHTPHSHTLSLSHAPSEKERMSALWDDTPRSAYGEPPQTPWGKTPAQTSRPLGGEGDTTTTVLLSATTPGTATGGHHMELPPTETLSRSISLSGKSRHGSDAGGIPLDADDVPPPGAEVTGGWGGVKTPRSIHATPSAIAAATAVPPADDPLQWSGDMQTPVPPAAATPAMSTASSKGSKIPKRSRKNSIVPSVLSNAKVASPVKSAMNAFGDAVGDLLGGGGEGEGAAGSPNLLAGAPGIGGHHHHGRQSGHPSPGKQALSPLNPASGVSVTQESLVHAPGGGSGDLNWESMGEGGGGSGGGGWDTGAHDNNNTGGDTWGFNDQPPPANNEILTREIRLSPAPPAAFTASPIPSHRSPGLSHHSPAPSHRSPAPSHHSPAPSHHSPAPSHHSPAPAAPPIDTQLEAVKTPKSLGVKTPKSIGSKTPKTPAVDIAKTPVIGESVSAEASTPTTPTASTAKKGGKKKKKDKDNAAAAAAEEEERKKRETEEEAERERIRLEQEEQARLAREAEEEAERQRIAAVEAEEAERQRVAAVEAEEAERQRVAAAAEAEAAAAAETERLANEERKRLAREEHDRLLKEEEEKLAKAIAEMEAEEAVARAQKEAEEAEAKAKEEKERGERERKEKEAKAAAAALNEQPVKGKKAGKKKKGALLNFWDEEEAKEKERVEQAAREAEERATKEKAERAAEEKMEQEAREEAERQLREKAEQEAREKVEQEAREREAAEQKAAEEAQARAEQEERERVEREAQERVEQEAREKAEQEALEKIEQEARERAEEEARKAEEERKAEETRKAEEAKVQAEKATAEKTTEETGDWGFAFTKPKKGKKGKGAKASLLDILGADEENAKAEEDRLAREKAEQEERETAEREKEAREKKEMEERENVEEREAANAGGEGGGSNSIFNFGGTGWGSSGGSGNGWSGFGSWGDKAKSKAPSIKNAIGSAWTNPSFGGFGFGSGGGDSQLSPEELKLTHVGGELTGSAPALFDDWDNIGSTTSNFADNLFNAPAAEHAGDTDTAHDPPLVPSKAPSQAPSKAQSRIPSRAPSPAPVPVPPIEPTTVPTSENIFEAAAEAPPSADADPIADLTTAEKPTAPGTPAAEDTTTPGTPAAEEATAPGTPAVEEPQTATADDEWGITVKVKKGKKKAGANSEPATPNPDGTSEASGVGAKKKKKKGK